MKIFLLTLSLLSPLMLQASEETPQEGLPTNRKRKAENTAENPYRFMARRDLVGNSPRSKAALQRIGALYCTEQPCNFMAIDFTAPELEATPLLQKDIYGTVYLSFFSRAASRRNKNAAVLLNVNTMKSVRLADFPLVVISNTFPNQPEGDVIVQCKIFSTRSLSPDSLQRLENRIDVMDYRNTSIRLTNNDAIFGNTRQICLSETASELNRRINKKISLVSVVYGNENTLPVTIDANERNERDQGIESLFPTDANLAAHMDAQTQAPISNQLAS